MPLSSPRIDKNSPSVLGILPDLPLEGGRQVKSLTEFLQYVLDDLGTWCRTSTIRDLQTVTERVEHEGLSFLTITLAAFGADFQKSLDQGAVAHDSFAGFSRTGGLPRFMGGFLELVFDRGTGRLLDEPSIDAIQAIRQFTLMWAKINLPCTKHRQERALDGYIECEKEVREADASLPEELRKAFARIGTLLWSRVLDNVDRRVDATEHGLRPKHGPGATADRLTGNRKWRQTEWPERLEMVLPYGDYAVPNYRYAQEAYERVDLLEPGRERPVKVTLVPKTLKTPRIIAMEPVAMQYMQQALLGAFVDAIEVDHLARNLIGWLDRTPNQRLAQLGSRDGSLATLDLSEASDRVSNQHVRCLLGLHPSLFQAVDACRSRKADVPGRGVIRLAKFASMGSALCFPLEAMVFCTIVFVGIEQALNRPLTRKDIESFVGQVRVFGDDIIVPAEFVPAVTRQLTAFGLKVNAHKSFWSGKFRESCGKDYYGGHDVSVVRIRSEFPTSRKHADRIVQTAEFRNRLYQAGLWKSARALDQLLERLIPWPAVNYSLIEGEWTRTSPVLGRHSFLGYDVQREDPELHRPLVKGMEVQDIIPVSILDGYDALTKCLLVESSELPIGASEHLVRAGRPVAVDIKQRWAPPY